MSKRPSSSGQIFFNVFCVILGMTIAVYLLRGFAILGFLPGAVLWILILLSIATGLASGIQRTKGRY